MMRTVWLATTCLAVLGTLAVGKALTTPVAPANADRAVDEATVGTDFNQDTLAKGDRLEITYVHQETPAQAAASQPTEAFGPPTPAIAPPVKTKIISRHWHDPNATPLSNARSKQAREAVATKKGKSVDQAAGRSKSIEPVKPCNRTGAFGDLLRSLNLSSACDS
jgi:hypothetical protein